jgi:hypothetical protein
VLCVYNLTENTGQAKLLWILKNEELLSIVFSVPESELTIKIHKDVYVSLFRVHMEYLRVLPQQVIASISPSKILSESVGGITDLMKDQPKVFA